MHKSARQEQKGRGAWADIPLGSQPGEQRKGNNAHHWHFLSISRPCARQARSLARMISFAHLVTLEAGTIPSSRGREGNRCGERFTRASQGTQPIHGGVRLQEGQLHSPAGILTFAARKWPDGTSWVLACIQFSHRASFLRPLLFRDHKVLPGGYSLAARPL